MTARSVTTADAPAPEPTADELRRAFAAHPSGVVAVCGDSAGGPVGMVASTFVPVSLAPALVAFCVQCSSTTWPRLRSLPELGISVLSSAHDAAARRLAARSGDRFAGLRVRTTGGGAVLLDGCGAALTGEVVEEVPAGDHRIVLLRVRSLRTTPDVEPLVFHGSAFRTLEVADHPSPRRCGP